MGQRLALQKYLAGNLFPLAFAHPLAHPAQNVLLTLLLESQQKSQLRVEAGNVSIRGQVLSILPFDGMLNQFNIVLPVNSNEIYSLPILCPKCLKDGC